MYCCTIESEVTTASSSEEPLVKIPVTLGRAHLTSKLRGTMGCDNHACLSANAFPTMHCPAPSSNQEPSTRHQGLSVATR